ncbi:MAG: selenocysteine-specific translation elongation factor [Chloroflexi bacterium]|nr:MAG: selenocysteine-specific translation elongation factor [Chloroflexota bacterium]
MYVIGTAGHVDHGKSTLVEALTGIDPDRLSEEKEREMTIDLGFAWLQLGDGEEVGIVDVPGHQDFIENMLAGVGGIDLALFVVAADEGVMPQTREHLAILDLLDVRGGIVALTKTDLIDDPDWLELVTLDLHETFTGTILAEAPIMPVSAKTGEGVAELRELLWTHLSAAEPRLDLGKPRLPVDRVFSLSGFGTVVTGTLLDGRFRVGDPVELQPSGLKGRIRGLQTHKTKLDVTLPGSRVAINISGVDKNDIHRGHIVAAPGVIGNTILLDASYRHLADASGPLKHNMEVKLYVGAAEVVARTRILGAQQINPGKSGWLQLALSAPVATARRDHFILRRPSPGETLGGGLVLDPHPGRRHRRFRPEIISRLETLAQGTPADLLLQTLRRLEPTSKQNLIQQANLDEQTAVSLLTQLENEQEIKCVGKQVISQAGWQNLTDKLGKTLQTYHQHHPLRLGIPKEELRSRLQLSPAIFNPLVTAAIENHLTVEEGTLLRQPDHQIHFSEAQETAVSHLLRHMSTAGITSPSVKTCKKAVGDHVYFALLDLRKLIQINNDVVYATSEYEKFTKLIIQYLQQHGEIDAAQTRDLLKTSRKYAIALLEHLDDIKMTKRIDDKRILR